MKIINDETVLNFLDTENNNKPPKMSLKQIQVHLDFNCGCKITQDKLGNSLFPCKLHENFANENRNNKI